MAKSPAKSVAVAGIMSGTSADGVDVALVRIRDSGDGIARLQLLAHEAFPYSAALRKAVLAAMNAQSTSTAELARLNWRLGVEYAKAAKATLERHPVQLSLIGCHGQTLYHQAVAKSYAGEKISLTWQAGEPAVLAGALGVPVVSNFRPADMVAGGQGAPLVPLLDFTLFRHPKRGRILQNIGGIANMTAIPPAAGADRVLAFDSGPGNMVIDALMQELYGQAFDRDGAVAAAGTVLEPLLKKALRHRYLRKPAPKTAGREQFGREFAAQFLAGCQMASSRRQDAIATATAFTAHSIAQAYGSFVADSMGVAPVDYIVSGGGARNATLMTQLTELLKRFGCLVRSSDSFGLPAEAKEAAAFALLAWQTWHRKPGNVPSATGAARPAILGQVTYV